MLYDDDQSGPPNDKIHPEDNRQWTMPRVDPAYLQRFDAVDRILIVLEIGRRSLGDFHGSFAADQVFANAGLTIEPAAVEAILGVLLPQTLITRRNWGNGTFYEITTAGTQRVVELTGPSLPGPMPEVPGRWVPGAAPAGPVQPWPAPGPRPQRRPDGGISGL
jgi:hypothetical protein